jgi:hypothetical protein
MYTLLVISVCTQAQVTIGTGEPPHTDALLDLKENVGGTSTKGFLLPRVSLTAKSIAKPCSSHVKGMVVYNTADSPQYHDDKAIPPVGIPLEDRVSAGFYYNTGTGWERLDTKTVTKNWFYMPSIPIDIRDGEHKYDLFLEYKKQFDDTQDNVLNSKSDASIISDSGPALIKSESAAPDLSVRITGSGQFYYYVTGYDTEVFSDISISPQGILRYKADASKISDKTYINIVLLEK